MKIFIERNGNLVEFDNIGGTTLLEALMYIKENIDSSLTFRKDCRSGVCGSCGVFVNDKEVLACKYKLSHEDVIKPLRNHKIIRDLVVESNSKVLLERAKTYLNPKENFSVTYEDEKRYRVESECILCGSCYSRCPVIAYKNDFLGPFALMRNYRYVVDNREENKKEKIDSVQNSGIWDCTLCGECSYICPQHIDIKGDISLLRSISFNYGYSDPNMFNSFGLDFL